MQTIRHAIRAVVDFAHNLYAQLPAAAQTFLMLAAFGLFAAAQGFNWTIPATGAQFHLELAAFAALAYGIVVPLFQTYILPNLLTWLIALLQIVPVLLIMLRIAQGYRQGQSGHFMANLDAVRAGFEVVKRQLVTLKIDLLLILRSAYYPFGRAQP